MEVQIHFCESVIQTHSMNRFNEQLFSVIQILRIITMYCIADVNLNILSENSEKLWLLNAYSITVLLIKLF